MKRALLLMMLVSSLLACDERHKTASVKTLEQGELEDVPFSFFSNSTDVLPGSEVELFYHSRDSVTFYLEHLVSNKTISLGVGPPISQETSRRSFFEGCTWQSPKRFRVPSSLNEGIYALKAETTGGEKATFPVVVSDDERSTLLVLCSTNTWQAYNSWGGGSFYRLDSSLNEFGTVSNFVNFKRPNPSAINSTHLVAGELHLHKWLAKKGIQFDLCTDRMLSEGFDLSGYKAVVLNCHNEYWTADMYNNIERYTQNGGNLFSLGGNQIYAKVTYQGDQMEFHEHGGIHLHDGTQAGLWRNLGRPESAILGVQYVPDLYGTYAPFQLVNCEHELTREISTKKNCNDVFGTFSDNLGYASGHEMDIRTEHSPKGTVLLAKGLNGLKEVEGQWSSEEGGAEIVTGKYESGGFFFSVGSITFTGALEHDSISSQLLMNALNKAEVQ